MYQARDSEEGELALRRPAKAGAPLRLFVLGEVRVLREGLARILSDEPSFSVVGAGAPDAVALGQISEAQPQVVVLDCWNACDAGLRGRLRECCKVLAVGVPHDAAAVLACVQDGVGGYVARDASPEALVQSVRQIASGLFPCPPEIAAVVFRQVAASRQQGGAPASLTSREREIVALIDRGLTNREIAAQLAIELPTVKNHVHNILEKLRVRRRAAAAAKLRSAGAA